MSARVNLQPVPSHTRTQLKRLRVMIIDNDARMSQVIRSTLQHMGFENVFLMRNTQHAQEELQNQHFDFIILDWDIRPLSGVQLLRHIRNAPASANPTVPVIMLTARGMTHDVETARDAGITEYLLKPFTAQSLFERISQIIEHPRAFIISGQYVGPDRRRKDTPPEGMQDRRGTKPIPLAAGKESFISRRPDPCMLLPDESLKRKLDLTTPLESIIDPATLAMAQQVINDNRDSSLEWIREDLETLERTYADMQARQNSPQALEDMQAALLSIKARAGTFGYYFSSDIAWSLYRFVRESLSLDDPNHLIVIHKHLQALKVAVASKIMGTPGQIEKQLLETLSQLVGKYGSL